MIILLDIVEDVTLDACHAKLQKDARVVLSGTIIPIRTILVTYVTINVIVATIDMTTALLASQELVQYITIHHTLMNVLLALLTTVLSAPILETAKSVIGALFQVIQIITVIITTLASSARFTVLLVKLTTSLNAPTAAKALNSEMESVNLVLLTVKSAKEVYVSFVYKDSL